MNEDNELPSGNLPAVQTLQLCAVPVRYDQLGPEEVDAILLEMRELARLGKSEPARVTAAKLVLDRLAPKADIEQQRREAEEANDAIVEAKRILAEFAASRVAGIYEPITLDQASPSATTDAGGDGT